MLTEERKAELRAATRANAGIGPMAFDLWYRTLADAEREFVSEYLVEYAWGIINDIEPDIELIQAYFREHLPALKDAIDDYLMALSHALENIRYSITAQPPAENGLA